MRTMLFGLVLMCALLESSFAMNFCNPQDRSFKMEVFSSHISILEKRSKRWTDRLRLGSFKIKSIEEEKALKQHIAEISKAKTHFALNDD